MATQLREYVADALPDEGAVLSALFTLPAEAWGEAALALAPDVPTFDVVLAVSGVGEAFAGRLAARAGVPLAMARRSEHRTLAPLAQRRALLASPLLTDGVPELELAALARQAGADVVSSACALEFTARGGRSRLDMLAVKVYALLQLAHTPGGLQFERRGAGGDVLIPLP